MSDYTNGERAIFHATVTAHGLCRDGDHDEAAVILQAAVNAYDPDEDADG